MSNLKLKLKRVDPVKYALITALIVALMSFIFIGIITLFAGLLANMDLGSSDVSGPLAMILGSGIGALILVPVIYFIFAFIGTLIGTMFFNFILKKTGGLQLDFEKAGIDISKIGEG